MQRMHLFALFALFVVASSTDHDAHDVHGVDLHSSSIDHDLNGSTHGSNETHQHEEHEHSEHHGIHVASWNFDYVKQPLIVTLFMLSVVLCKVGFHKVHILSNFVPESCLLILLGTAVGAILHATDVDTSYFYYIHPGTFFLFLLPPCILEAAYELHDTVFFENLGTVLLYAVIGTLINCFIIGPAIYGLALVGVMGSLQISFVQCLVFSSLIVAVDPVAVLAIFQEIGVNNVLYFLVFGESLLNDAVTVVLYNTMTTLSTMDEIPVSEILMAFAAFFTVSLGGLSIGLLFGIITSIVTRWTQHVRVVEPLEILAMAYGSYLTAELFHFSGIISMIGCGLVQVHYAFHNISQNSATTVKYFIKMLSTTCDSIIFMFLGIALVRDDHVWNTGFVLCSVFLCLFTRFLVTITLTVFANFTYRERKVNAQEQFIMGYGGLRGAVCFCLVAMLDENKIPQKYIFQTAVFAVILFTVFIQGISIKPLVYKLKILLNEDKVLSLYQEINEHVTDHALAGVEGIIGRFGHNKLKEFMIKIDDALKKVLQRDPLSNDQVIMELYKEMAVQQYLETMWGAGEDEDSSQLALYHAPCRSGAENLETKPLLQAGAMHVPCDPRILRKLETMGVNDTFISMRSRQSMPIPLDNMSRTAPTSPNLEAGDKEKFQRFFSETGETYKNTAGAGMRRRAFNNRASTLIRKSINGPDIDEQYQAVSTKNLRKMLAKTSATNAFVRKTDRNLKNTDGTDLVFQLHEKQRRHNRLADGAMSPRIMSRQQSPFGSLDQLDNAQAQGVAGSELVNYKLASTPALNVDDITKNVGSASRTRQRSEGSKGPIVLYVPKYKPRRAVRLNEQQRRYTVTDSTMTGEEPAGVGDESLGKERNRSSLPASVEHSMLKDDAANCAARSDSTSADECIILLVDDPSMDSVSSTCHGKLHAKLQRQDDLKVDV